MAAIETWLRQPAAQAVAWALLQFVWQGAVVGGLTALALLALRRSAADVRYVIASIGLALMMTLPIVSGVQKYQALSSAAAFEGTSGVALQDGILAEADGTRGLFDRLKGLDPTGAAASQRSASSSQSAPDGLRAIMPVFLVLWCAGVMLLTLRLLTGWLWVQRLRTHGVTGAPDGIRRSAARLAQRLHITRAVTLLESSLVDVPTVIGFLKPAVLLPASALAGLTPQQIEAVLAHELAHIRRHDYLVNLLQTLVETVLFYHPAVWWLSHRIRIERENCCDDLAVNLCGDRVAYATALADLEALRGSGPTPVRHIAMAATGGSLLQRVRRLLGAPTSHSGRGPAWLAGAAALLLVGGIAAGAERAPRARAVVAPAGAVAADAPALAAQPGATAAPAIARLPAVPGSAPAEMPAVAESAGVLPAEAGSQSLSVSHDAQDSSGTWAWSNNGDRLEVTYNGKFTLSDDDSDVRELSSGGSFKISDGRWLGRHSVEIRERNGALEHHYYVNAAERPFEPEGRTWLREQLPRFIRNSGFGAESHVARELKAGGPAAVLAEISRLESGYVKGLYFKELFRQATLTPAQYRDAMVQAGREMRGSSYELAQLLIAVADKLPDDEASRTAYFAAAFSIKSDYEVRRVYSAMLKRGPVASATVAGILTSAKAIHSDYDLSELLRLILAQQPLDDANRGAFFAAVATLGSSYERHRVLSATVSSQHASDPALLELALTAATHLGSDYDTSTFLQEVLRQNGVEAGVRAPFFACVNTIGSSYERGRVLQAVVRKPGTSDETLHAVLQAARSMGGYELSQVLQLIARTQPLTGDLRDAYVAAADRLGDYEQTQALAALVRSERRR